MRWVHEYHAPSGLQLFASCVRLYTGEEGWVGGAGDDVEMPGMIGSRRYYNSALQVAGIPNLCAAEQEKAFQCIVPE